MDDEELPPLGLVPVEGRGSLPFALVHGESLVAAASWALTGAGVELHDAALPYEELRDAGRDLVLHDPLCPLTPVAFLAEAVALARRTGAVVVGVRPVTDTVKEVVGDDGPGVPVLGATVDREQLVQVASPVVLPAAVVAGLPDLVPDLVPDRLVDLAGLVAVLTARVPVRHLVAPALARRVGEEPELEVLAALSTVLHDAHDGPGGLSDDA